MIAEVEVKHGQLTKTDLDALRRANMASFHWDATFEDLTWKGEGHISLTRRLPNAGPLDEQERTHRIQAKGSLKDYCDKDRARDWGKVHCFTMEHTCSMSPEWQTVVAIAKVGDRLEMQWTKDAYNSGYARDADGVPLHFDRMALIVVRGERRFLFNLQVSLCPSNTARMIRSRIF